MIHDKLSFYVVVSSPDESDSLVQQHAVFCHKKRATNGSSFFYLLKKQ
jgi:hypothetical protein